MKQKIQSKKVKQTKTMPKQQQNNLEASETLDSPSGDPGPGAAVVDGEEVVAPFAAVVVTALVVAAASVVGAGVGTCGFVSGGGGGGVGGVG